MLNKLLKNLKKIEQSNNNNMIMKLKNSQLVKLLQDYLKERKIEDYFQS